MDFWHVQIWKKTNDPISKNRLNRHMDGRTDKPFCIRHFQPPDTECWEYHCQLLLYFLYETMPAFLLQQIECCYYSFNLFHIKCAFSLKMASINNLCIKTYTCCINVLYALESDADFKLWMQNRLSWFCKLVNMFNKGAHFRTKHLKWILTLFYKKASIALAAERLYILPH